MPIALLTAWIDSFERYLESRAALVHACAEVILGKRTRPGTDQPNGAT